MKKPNQTLSAIGKAIGTADRIDYESMQSHRDAYAVAEADAKQRRLSADAARLRAGLSRRGDGGGSAREPGRLPGLRHQRDRGGIGRAVGAAPDQDGCCARGTAGRA